LGRRLSIAIARVPGVFPGERKAPASSLQLMAADFFRQPRRKLDRLPTYVGIAIPRRACGSVVFGRRAQFGSSAQRLLGGASREHGNEAQSDGSPPA